MCDVTCAADTDCQTLGGDFRCLAQHCRVPVVSGAGGADAGPGLTCQASPTPNPMQPSTTQFDPSVLARVAVVIGSCVNGANDDGIGRNAAHLWSSNLSPATWQTRLMAQADCLAAADCGCGAIDRCAGYALKPLTPDCKSGCNGSVFTACGPGLYDPPTGYSEGVDCAAVGLACDSASECVVGPVVACSSTMTPDCNADGAPEYCLASAVRHTPACSTLGLTCQNGECTGSGASCVNQSSGPASTDEQAIDGIACSGSALQACFGGHSETIDCGTIGPGFSCQSAGGKFFCGLASECEPASEFAGSVTFPDTCTGSTLSFCNAGRIEHIDCVALGFSRCQTDPRFGCF